MKAGDRIIIDDRMLCEEYVPQELVGRSSQLRLLEDCLSPVCEGRRPVHAWLHGCPGSGKTAVAKAALERIHKETGIRYVAVNCWERGSVYEVLDQIVTDLAIFHAEQHRSSVKIERLRRHLGNTFLFLLIDEIDKIVPAERSRVLYSLDSVGRVGMVCVSGNLHALFELEERVRSRINPRTIGFGGYSVEQIWQILARRACEALGSDACPEYLLKRIAAACCGDARVAIRMLANAAESAERAGHASIEARHVRGPVNDSRAIRAERALAHLTQDHRMLHRIVSRRRQMLSTDLWATYRTQCSQTNRRPIAVRTFSAYVTQLTRLGLISCERARIKGNVRLLKAQL